MKNQTYFIQTFGCAMNIADSERFRTILTSLSLEEANSRKEADILIFNTCSVRQKAEDRIYGLKKEIAKLREQNPSLITILTGCMARRKFNEKISRNTKTQKTNEKRAAEIKRQAPWLDIIIETKNFHKIGEKLKDLGTKANIENSFLDVRRTPTNSTTAGITISHGCDHMCTFCIVPFARGREICRDFEPILEETKEALAFGAKDIVLLGQTVNRWINPKFKSDYIKGSGIRTKIEGLNETRVHGHKDPKDFLQLLENIDRIDGDFWLSFISSHPNYYSRELIKYITESIKSGGHIRPYIHLALQSGNNEILKRMRRNHTIEEFIEKIELMRELIPEVSITTDIIVGFPDETQSQFQDTARICKKLKFDQIYISEYSQREGTGSSFFEDNIAHEEKQKRKMAINDILRKTALENNKKLIDTQQRVLIIKHINKNTYQARTEHNKLVQINSKTNANAGEFVQVKITQATPWALSGIANYTQIH